MFHKGRRIEGLWQRRTADGRARFDAVAKAGGRTVRRVLEAETVTDAVRERQALLVELRGASTRRHGGSVTFARGRVAYVEHLELLARSGERSARSAAAAAARLERLERLPLDAIGPPELAAAVRDLRARGYSGWSIKTTVLAFSACWTFAAREHGWCSEAARPTLSRPIQITRENARQPRRLNDAQVHDLVQSAPDAARPLVALLAYTGLRLGEALALRWQDVDLVDGVLRVEFQLDEAGRPTERLKAESSRRQVPIPGPLRAVLTEHLAGEVELDRGRPGDFVLMGARGTGPYTNRRAHALFKRAAVRAGLAGLRPHDLRHSYGSILLDKGAPLPTVSRLLGHSSTQTTARIYAGVVEGNEQRTGELVGRAFAGSGDHEVATEELASSTETTETPDYQGVS